MQKQTAKWQSMWPLLALLGALAAFGLGALTGVFGPQQLQVWARHEQVSGALDALLFNLRDAEDAQRDFLLRGEAADLRHARAAAAAARDAADRLRRLSSQEFAQQRRTGRLWALALRHLDTLEAGIAMRLTSPGGRATIRGSDREQERMAEIRNLAAAVRREERLVLRRGLERADTGRQVVAFVSGGAGLLLFGLLPVAIWLARRNRIDVTERKRAEHSLRFLAEAGNLLAGSLDYDATLRNVARLAVETIADFCFFVLVADGGPERARTSPPSAEGAEAFAPFLAQGAKAFAPFLKIEHVAWAHRDPERQRELDDVRRFLPSAVGEDHPVTRVLRDGRGELVPVVTDEWLQRAATGEEHYRFLRGLGLHSLMIVPVAAAERRLGTLTFCCASRGARAYDASDLELAEELGRRAGIAIENARLYLATREANAAKDHFLATLSHELRTPLTPVLAVVSALEEDRRLPRDVRDRLATVRRNTELEARLIDDLLDLTRIERGKLDLHREVTDLLPLLAHAVEVCRTPETEHKALRLVTELAADDHRVWADDSRLAQVFWNLLKNAVKFTPAGGAIRVRSWNETAAAATPAAPAADTGEWLVIEVSDTGIGIEPDLLPRIFDAFEQGQRTITRRFGGLGLGLAISRAIVEMHGGTLTAASEGRERGAAFTVRLPLGLPEAGMDTAALVAEWAVAEEEAAAIDGAPDAEPGAALMAGAGADAASSGRRAARPLHVLLVEDHEDTAEAMADLLRANGHRVTVAGSVGEALTVVENATAAAAAAPEDARNGGAIDLVVSDLGLPDGSGCDLMRVLAGRYGLRGIALSGYGMEEDVQQSREAGFERHLTKPVDIRMLESAIQGAKAFAPGSDQPAEAFAPGPDGRES